MSRAKALVGGRAGVDAGPLAPVLPVHTLVSNPTSDAPRSLCPRVRDKPGNNSFLHTETNWKHRNEKR